MPLSAPSTRTTVTPRYDRLAGCRRSVEEFGKLADVANHLLGPVVVERTVVAKLSRVLGEVGTVLRCPLSTGAMASKSAITPPFPYQPCQPSRSHSSQPARHRTSWLQAPKGSGCSHAEESLDECSGVRGADDESRVLLADELVVEPVGDDVGQVLRRDAVDRLRQRALPEVVDAHQLTPVAIIGGLSQRQATVSGVNVCGTGWGRQSAHPTRP